MVEFTTEDIITVKDLKRFLDEYEVPDDTMLCSKAFEHLATIPTDKLYFDKVDRSLTFEF
ncbi:hypothetical protein [Spartinivicinus ruber]|uniref:hypothetical protein n=1 Tax=Spartinivicinus ruber TaxID=2683272 RepID=UPI0013D8AD0E|nr:hypothetical protein [Spartinivicinus ruber]